MLWVKKKGIAQKKKGYEREFLGLKEEK